MEQLAAAYRQADPAFSHWAAGYGMIQHDPLTQLRVREMVAELVALGQLADPDDGWRRLAAADRLASAAIWLVVHMTYARRVRTDGAALAADDFKAAPEGHTGGSLNMVPAYAGYLLMDALDGTTRAWMMGQGHCVAAIDALNVLVGNMTPAHASRYDRTDAGLSRLCGDFYAYTLKPDGSPESPLGSHVNAHTAGGILEGGYLGFAELQYVHAPLKGERLVAFLSDGAFEEQRGSDWAPRWWRAEDSGLVSPIIILNGRRIEQRSQIAQQGGDRWLHQHLRLNGFEPVGIDGRDPASIAWGIHAMESRLRACGEAPEGGIRLPYGIAETIKGYGFPGAGTNAAHNLPLPGNPAHDVMARDLFNEGAAALFVPVPELDQAISSLNTHREQQRVRERDHALATRDVAPPKVPAIAERLPGQAGSPMRAMDEQFVAIVEANPQLRVRLGNPDELRSNRLDRSLDLLKHRVQIPETGNSESATGAVITALNEEAVVCAALANKGGLNLVVTYEAFAPKMLGAIRQELIFSRQLRLAGRSQDWLGIPLVLTSHTWENAKNEQSHQDPTMTEALLGEMADVSRVVFPPDANAAAAALARAYAQRGTITALVVPKRDVPHVLTRAQAAELAAEGAVRMAGDPDASSLLLVATGAYQLQEVLRARARLAARDVPSTVVYLGEPARYRTPRDRDEAAYVHGDGQVRRLFPDDLPRVLLTHTRPEPYLGALRRLDTGPATTTALGFINHGGTMDVPGLLFANRCTWAHVVEAAAGVLGLDRTRLLNAQELAAIDGTGDPATVLKAAPESVR
ncbi:xylulose 5-phosphate 3-epimerase [Rhodanobacter thiooxydans]|uniref:Xylulose 5-phosphate 3-epimerase n=2 Tax=Rhodanobacter thiooxydans TaxID=416169 RepID=A0A154QD14_9GAMM|nr:D-xylulose 5-phosphate/D-fructose 6-phosphate phosphoketolase [Rhodanobacter thiooxydans LCS2]KZC22112.1 xylulose 5-phosphate 3-epimerase [Rhodanobacter thiooxydans]